MMNKVEKVDTLVPDFRRNVFIFYPFTVMLVIGLSYIAFIMWRHIPSIPSYITAFTMKECLIHRRLFLHFLRFIIELLFFYRCTI
jgi:hypothetical protein